MLCTYHVYRAYKYVSFLKTDGWKRGRVNLEFIYARIIIFSYQTRGNQQNLRHLKSFYGCQLKLFRIIL